MNNRRNSNDERPTAKSTTIPPPVPPFRSVRMNVATPPPPAISFGSSAGPAKVPSMVPSTNAIRRGPVTMKMAPPKPIGLAPTNETNHPSVTTSNATSSSQVPNFVWKLDRVSTVPVYHPLERTAVTFSNDEHPLDLITERISGFMKEHSIFTKYDDEMARVVCSTNCCVHFSVQLWKKDSSSTIMEIQRQQGCAIRMQSLRNQLKETILMGSSSTTHEDTAKCPMYLQQQLARMVPAIPSAAAASSSSGEGSSCLDLCRKMLSSELHDQHRMGLESLCVLTDASKVQDPQESCDKVLQDESLQSLLVEYIASADQEANLHLLALKAVAQALENASADSSGTIDVSSAFWQTVLQAHYQHIQRPHEKPIEASLSIKSLRFLQEMRPEVMDILQRKHSLPVTTFLHIAHEFGKQHNRTLEREAKQFMTMKHYVH